MKQPKIFKIPTQNNVKALCACSRRGGTSVKRTSLRYANKTQAQRNFHLIHYSIKQNLNFEFMYVCTYICEQ